MLLKRLFNRARLKPVIFSPTQKAFLHEVPPTANPAQALEALDLPPYHAAMVVHSGAAGMSEDSLNQLDHLFAEGLVRFANDKRVLVVDGATAAGAAVMLGKARTKQRATFPLLGVTVSDTITYPGGPSPAEGRYPLEPNHSHFLIVQAAEFGAESPLIVGSVSAKGLPHLALIVNGGAIVRHEAEMHAQRGTPLVVLKGSGRYADELANATATSDIRAAMPANARIEVFDVANQSPADFYALLQRLLGI